MDRHEVPDNGENHQSHDELLEEIAQLEERERVLIGENDDLRGQLAEMKKEEKKKFDDLMVEHRQLKDNANRSQRAENGDSLVPNGIHIKHEHLDEQSNNGQQMYNEDNPDTNPFHNVTVNIKTEPKDCDFVVVKQEIKEEEDEDTSTNTNQVTVKTESIDEDVKVEIKEEIKEEDDHDDDCDGCVRCLVKKEEVSDDDEVGHDEGELIRGGEHDEVDAERYEVIQPSIDNGQLLCSPSQNIQNDSNLNESIDDEGDANLASEQMLNTANEPYERTGTPSGDLFSPSTSTAQDSNRTALTEQSTVSTRHNANKRKQAQSNRTAKRSKKTLEKKNGEDGEDIATDDQVDDRIKVIHFNCTEDNCDAKLNLLDKLHSHLLTIHGILPHRCFEQTCNSQFNHPAQMAVHLKRHHSNPAQFVCHFCGKEFTSQNKTYNHWYQQHLTGQFECNLNQCTKVLVTRYKVHNHQYYKHSPEWKRFTCAHHGCASSFATKKDLARHESSHLDTRPFHCIWPQCSHSAKERANLLKHIRTQHFGLPKTVKEQKEKKIEDYRDPNEYVRVVE